MTSLRETLSGAGEILWNVLLAPVRRRATNRWGATPAEVSEALLGDELVPNPRLSSTRAVTIGAPPEVVWAWLEQIGHGRGGLYSFDGLENAVGCDLHSADSILVDLPLLARGDLVALGPAGYPCFRVESAQPPRSLVLVAADRLTREVPALPVPQGVTGSTWQWHLRPLAGGRSTRLVARQRYSFPRAALPLWRLVEPIDFVMERRMLRGIRERAEGSSRLAAAPVGADRG